MKTHSVFFIILLVIHINLYFISAAQKKLLKMKPQQPLNPHILKTSVIGSPNAGKSTLVNQLTGWQVSNHMFTA